MIFGVWYFSVGRSAYHHGHGSLTGVRRFVTTGLENAFARMGQVRGVGVLLAVVIVVGLCVAWAPIPLATIRRRAAAPAALLIGAEIFLAIAGYGRTVGAFGADFARQSRYIHVVAAMTLPAIAVAADALGRRWRVLTPVVIVLLLVGIPGNIDAITPTGQQLFTRGNRSQMLGLAWSPFARRVPRSLHPVPGIAAEVTVGWLIDGARSGRIPRPKGAVSDAAAEVALVLLLKQTTRTGPTRDCVAVVKPLRLQVRRGDVLAFRDGIPAIQLLLADGSASPPRVFRPTGGAGVQVEAGPVTLLISRAPGSRRLVLCHGPGAPEPGRP